MRHHAKLLVLDVSARVGYLNPAWNEPADAQTVDVSPPFFLIYVVVIRALNGI